MGIQTFLLWQTQIPVIDNKTLITEIIEKNNSLGMTRLLQVSAVTKGELNGKDLVDFEENRKATRFFGRWQKYR